MRKRLIALTAAFLFSAGYLVSAEINDLNIVDASNTARFPENMAPSAVNDGARALEGLLARHHEDAWCRKASTGSANAYVFAAAQTLTAYYDGLVICFDANFANTGSATLNVDSVSADTIVLPNGQSLSGGEIISGQKVQVVHDGTNWVLLSARSTGNVLFYDDDAGAAAGPIVDRHRDSASPATNDVLAEDRWSGEDSAGNKHTYGALRAEIVTATDGSEDGRLEIDAISGLNLTVDSDGITQNGVIIPRGYIDGLTMVNAADANHDIRIEAGQAADSGNVALIQRTSQIIKQIDANWAQGTNQGGFPSGLTLSASTWYHMFVIRAPSDGDVDAGFDTSLTATNLLADATGFTQYRRIGSVLTNGSSNIIAFDQDGDHFLWDVPVSDYNVSNPGTSATLRALTVPDGVKVLPKHSIAFHHGGIGSAVSLLVTSPDQADTAPSATIFTLRTDTDAASAKEVSGHIQVWTDTSRQIRTRFDASGANLDMQGVTHGWIDRRGAS